MIQKSHLIKQTYKKNSQSVYKIINRIIIITRIMECQQTDNINNTLLQLITF